MFWSKAVWHVRKCRDHQWWTSLVGLGHHQQRREKQLTSVPARELDGWLGTGLERQVRDLDMMDR